MEYKEEYLKLTTDPQVLADESYNSYVAHLVCNEGELRFKYQENPMTCKVGEALICIPGIFSEVQASADLKVRIVLTHIDFHYMATPQSNYGVQGSLSLFLNPIIPLNEAEWKLLNQDIDNLEYRLQHTELFRQDVLQCATQMLFLDLFQPHARMVSDAHVSQQQASTMMQFINLLQQGSYIQHRDVSWYASELCVTAKHLSEISVQCSGYNASYWINRFTITEIHRRLLNRNLSLPSIIEEFGFCSPSHFSRYVLQHLGQKPSEFRG